MERGERNCGRGKKWRDGRGMEGSKSNVANKRNFSTSF